MKHRSAHSTTLVGTVSSRLVWHESFGFAPWLKQAARVLAGDAQGGGSPLVGGAGSIDACQRLLLASSVLPAWGEPSPPRLAPRGNGKGGSNSLLPQANSGGRTQIDAARGSFPWYRFACRQKDRKST